MKRPGCYFGGPFMVESGGGPVVGSLPDPLIKLPFDKLRVNGTEIMKHVDGIDRWNEQ